MHMPVRRSLIVLMVAAVLAATAGCSSSSKGPGDSAVALPAAKKLLDETSGVDLELSTDKLPDGVDGLVDAKGVGIHPPAFEGTVGLVVSGLATKVPVIAVDHRVFAKLPFTIKYAEIDPAAYGAPDPAQLMDPTTGLSSWLTAVTRVEQGNDVREGSAVLSSYSGTLPGEAVVGVIPSADKSADFHVSFHLADNGELRSLDVSGPFYGKDGKVDYTVALSGYGTQQDITAP